MYENPTLNNNWNLKLPKNFVLLKKSHIHFSSGKAEDAKLNHDFLKIKNSKISRGVSNH
jgi:hypothetical protein